MTQEEYFTRCGTDELLSMRYARSCFHPVREGDPFDYVNDQMWDIDKTLLYAELSRRPHRVRKRDRRVGGDFQVKRKTKRGQHRRTLKSTE